MRERGQCCFSPVTYGEVMLRGMKYLGWGLRENLQKDWKWSLQVQSAIIVNAAIISCLFEWEVAQSGRRVNLHPPYCVRPQSGLGFPRVHVLPLSWLVSGWSALSSWSSESSYWSLASISVSFLRYMCAHYDRDYPVGSDCGTKGLKAYK